MSVSTMCVPPMAEAKDWGSHQDSLNVPQYLPGIFNPLDNVWYDHPPIPFIERMRLLLRFKTIGIKIVREAQDSLEIDK